LKGKGLSVENHDLWIVYVKRPELTDSLPVVRVSDKEDISYLDIFDAEDFFNNYYTGITQEKQIKLKTYLFGRPDAEFRKKAGDFLNSFIKDNYNIELKEIGF